jgi:hypothetical protein
MARRMKQTSTKRQRERSRQQRQLEKERRRVERQAERQKRANAPAEEVGTGDTTEEAPQTELRSEGPDIQDSEPEQGPEDR